MITVYDFPNGARGLRTAWLCAEMGVAHAFVPIAFPPDQEYRALNPLGTVPFLRDGAVAMCESVAMMLYVAQRYGPAEALPPTHDGRFARVMQFAVFGEATLSSPMTTLFAARFGAPEEQKRNWSVTWTESRLAASIEHVASELGEREFLVGSALTVADISVMTALRMWTRGLKRDLPAALQVYCGRLEQRPAFQRALASHC